MPKTLFRGNISVKETDGWLQPLRFTEKQLESYKKTEALRIRAASPAGVRFCFHTAAKHISMRYRIEGRARNWAAFDLLGDGQLKDSVVVWDDEGKIEFALSGDSAVKYEIYLPHLVEVLVKDIEADSALLPYKTEETFWLCLGDSITQGMDAVHPAMTYPARVSNWLSLDVLNAGVGGGVFCAENLAHVGREPDVITVALGCNDWGHAAGRKELIENTRAYINKLITLYTCKNIYGILPIWRSDADTVRSGMTFDTMRSLIRSEYEKVPYITIIDGMKMVPPQKCFYGDAGELKAHPNAEGFLHYAYNLSKVIKVKG